MTDAAADAGTDADADAGAGTGASEGIRSPGIGRLDWAGREAEGLPPARDFVLYPGGGRPWDRPAHGTRHSPGVQPGDVHELLERGATVIVLSLGMEEGHRIAPPTLELLGRAGVEVHVRETRAAAALYNTLASRGRAVGGLFHPTC